MTTPAAALNAQSAASTAPQSPVASDLFALTDEQILDIQPDVSESSAVEQSLSADEHNVARNSSSPAEHGSRTTEHAPPVASHESPVTNHASAEPPPWLAAQMADPRSGAEARDLWNGIQQARNEAAAFREVFAKPEEARAASDRARTLSEIDAAFFGGAGKSAEEISTGRAALAQRMLREDPAAFREMVFAGLRALESAAQSPGNNSLHVAPPFRVASSASLASNGTDAGLSDRVGPQEARKPSATQPAPAHESLVVSHESQLAAYTAFEKSTNEDLERSVGSAIQHSLEQVLPNLSAGARHAVPASASLQARLQQNIRDNVESALKSDQQLGEQLARVLSARRFDETTRSQVVRLINDRAQQLVPGAARRVIQEWTQTTFAAHVGPGAPAPSAGAAAQPQRSPAFSLSTQSRPASSRASAPAVSAKAAAADRAERDVAHTPRSTSRPNGRAVDYHRLSDEQILEL